MLKQIKKALVLTFLVCFLANPVVVAETENSAPLPVDSSKKEQMNLIQKDIKVNDLDIEPINTQDVRKSVVPDTRQEGKKVIGLFLKTMMAVAFSAGLLYVILLFVKRHYGNKFSKDNETEEFETLDLSTPNSKEDALKSFLNRTK